MKTDHSHAIEILRAVAKQKQAQLDEYTGLGEDETMELREDRNALLTSARALKGLEHESGGNKRSALREEPKPKPGMADEIELWTEKLEARQRRLAFSLRGAIVPEYREELEGRIETVEAMLDSLKHQG